jgi:outer membrane biosynthesis protein TonB
MSLILDALNRSRQDSTPVPGLGTEPYMEHSRSRWQRYLPWSGLLVALLVIALLVLERGEPESTAVLRPAITSAPALAPTVPADKVVDVSPPPASTSAVREAQSPTTPEKASSVQQQVDPAVAELYRQKVVEPVAEPQLATVAEPEPEQEQEQEVQAVELQVPAEPEKAAPVEKEQPVDIEKLVLQARDEMEDARLEEHPAPFVSELSQQTKNAIPTVYYQRHEYSGNTGQSAVVLNGKSLKVGGSPVAGMKVREILPDSVVLDYRGTQFRLRALNSWINL